MQTYTQIFYHIIFSTKHRAAVLSPGGREKLFRYVWGVIRNRKSVLYRINGTEDHLHILSSLHQTIPLADFVKEIKTGSTKWIKANMIFPDFSNWQDGYGAFTHSRNDKDRLIEYIKRQAEHHGKISFEDELGELLAEAGVEFDEKWFV